MQTRSPHQQAIFIGFLLMMAWTISSAFGQIFTSNIEQAANPVFVCLLTTVIAVVCFLVMGKLQWKETLAKVKQHRKLVILINITTVCVWLFNLYPLKYIEPAIVVAIILGVRPLTGLLATHLVYKKDKIHVMDLLLSSLTFLFVLYLVYVSLSDKSGLVSDISIGKQLFCLGLCIVAGSVLSFNMVYTKQLSDIGFRPSEILSVRFWLLILITLCLSWHADKTPALHLSFWLGMLISSLALLVLPQYCLQNAVRRLKPIASATMVPLMPVLVFFLEFTTHRLHPTYWSVIGILGTFITTVIYGFFRYYVEKKAPV